MNIILIVACPVCQWTTRDTVIEPEDFIPTLRLLQVAFADHLTGTHGRDDVAGIWRVGP